MLDDWKRKHALLCQPSQGETLLRHYRPSLASRRLRRRKRQGFTLFGALARHAPILRSVCVLLMVLSLVVLPAQVQGAPANFVLTWQHQQDASTPAIGYAVQRCIQSDTTCTMSDLPGATQIPYATPTYTDSTIQPNISYCYQVAAVNQFGRQGRQPIVLIFGPTIFDCDVPALSKASLAQASKECGYRRRPLSSRCTAKEPDHRRCSLLRTRHERPSGCRTTK